MSVHSLFNHCKERWERFERGHGKEWGDRKRKGIPLFQIAGDDSLKALSARTVWLGADRFLVSEGFMKVSWWLITADVCSRCCVTNLLVTPRHTDCRPWEARSCWMFSSLSRRAWHKACDSYSWDCTSLRSSSSWRTAADRDSTWQRLPVKFSSNNITTYMQWLNYHSAGS